MNFAVPKIQRTECSALPKGWIREEVPRITSHNIGAPSKADVYYISPMGKKIKSKPELAKVLGDNYDLVNFDYYSGKVAAAAIHKPRPKTNNATIAKPPMATGYDLTKAVKTDASLVPPIRQTASIFKQPVTVHKSQTSCGKVKIDKQCTTEKPRQLFWEKRLAGLRPTYPNDDYQPFKLPSSLRPVGPGISAESVLASLSTSIHLSNGAIVGQTLKKSHEDLSVFLNADQPLIISTSISQADIERQEAKVMETRLKLAKAIEALSG